MEQRNMLAILIGPPGSGKSTFCKNNLFNCLRISQDDQGKVGHMDLFKKAIEDKVENIVIDRMNFNKQQRNKYLSLIPKDYLIVFYLFLPSKDVCLKRIEGRKDHPTLGMDKAEEVINFFHKSYEAPTLDEAKIIIHVEDKI